MNKSDLISAIAEDTNVSKADVDKVFNATISSVTDALRSGNSVTIVGFGTFMVRDRAARSGRNPKTGETINIPASRVPAFKPGKNLKNALNPSY